MMFSLYVLSTVSIQILLFYAIFGNMKNLAFKKTVYSSNPSSANKSNVYGVDGNIATSFYFAGKSGWFVVDLGGEYRVSYVQVYNRKDCCGERLSYFGIGMSMNFTKINVVKNEICGVYQGKTSINTMYKLNCNQPLSATRYVTLYVSHLYHDMRFQELEIYGDDIDLDECKENNPCDQTMSTCHNTEGSFVCECNSGYGKSSGMCQDLDECTSNPCDDRIKNCENTVGSYRCNCKLDTDCSNDVSIKDSLKSLFGGTVAGAVVGVLVLVFLIILTFICFYRTHRFNKKSTETFIENGTTEEETGYERNKKISNIKIVYNKFVTTHNKIKNKTYVNNTEAVIITNIGQSTVDNVTSMDYAVVSSRIKLENIHDYYNENDALIISQFKKVPMKCDKGIVVGNKKINKNKNNFKDILPFDFNRVKLTRGTNDYINASYIKSYCPNDYKFIATQGMKKEEEFEDFWKMVVQEQVKVIIMLTPLIENQMKSLQYWPDSGTKEYGNFRVEFHEVMKWPSYEIRNFNVSQKESSVSLLVHHMFYLEWPDHGVPCNVASLLNFHHKSKQLVQQNIDFKKNDAYKNEQAVNLIVHCSAGVGRTGTMIGIDCLIVEGKQSGFIDPIFCLKKLRTQRNMMIQNENQFLFCYKVLAVFEEIGDTTIYTKKNNALRNFMSGDIEKLNNDFKNQIKLIEENRYNIKSNKNAKKSIYSELYPSFCRPQAFRLCSIEDLSESLFLDLLLDSSFVLVLNQNTMEQLNKLLPEQNQSINLKNFAVTRMNESCLSSTKIKLENCTSSKENVPSKDLYENSTPSNKSITIECASGNNDVTKCFNKLKKLQDTKEQPVFILYSNKDRQECLWSLVKFHLLEMMDKHAEVDVYQSVYNIYNCSSTTHNFNLDVDSYKQMHQFALELLEKDHLSASDETQTGDIINPYENYQNGYLNSNDKTHFISNQNYSKEKKNCYNEHEVNDQPENVEIPVNRDQNTKNVFFSKYSSLYPLVKNTE